MMDVYQVNAKYSKFISNMNNMNMNINMNKNIQQK